MKTEYMVDDVLELADGDLFVAMNMVDGGEVYGPPTYVRVPREIFRDYEAFQALLMRDVGIAYHHEPADECDGEWSKYTESHLRSSGASVTAWRTTMTVGA